MGIQLSKSAFSRNRRSHLTFPSLTSKLETQLPSKIENLILHLILLSLQTPEGKICCATDSPPRPPVSSSNTDAPLHQLFDTASEMSSYSFNANRKLGWAEPEHDGFPTPIISKNILKDARRSRKQTDDGSIAFDSSSSTDGSTSCNLTELSMNILNSQSGVGPEIAPFIHNLPSVLVPDKKRRQCGILKQFATPRFRVREVDKSCEHHDFTVAQYRKLWKYAVSQVDVEKELYIEVMRKQHPGLGDQKLWELVRQELAAFRS